MRSLFARVKNTIEADIHSILDQKEQKNPISSLNQYLRQCEQEVEKVKKLLERQYTLKEQFSHEFIQAQQYAEKRKRQAEVALAAKESELYEFIIQEQAHYEQRAARLKESLQKVTQQWQELQQKLEAMKQRLKDMHIRRMELMGRENMARADYWIHQFSEYQGPDESPFSRFAEMERYIDQLERRIHSDYQKSTIDARIAELEKSIS